MAQARLESNNNTHPELVGPRMFVDTNWNVVTLLFGGTPADEAVVYLLVALARPYELSFANKPSGAGGAAESTRRKAT